MDIVLIAGLWLPVSVWSKVASELEGRGHHVSAVHLPGVDDGSDQATLMDQLDAALDAVDALDRPLVVGHSAACTLAWMVADRRPETISAVALIGGFPAEHGEKYADFFSVEDGLMSFPGWEPFEGPDSADLSDLDRDSIAAAAIGVPEGVSKGDVTLTDDRRFGVPVIVVCPEFSPEQAKGWINNGDVPELSRATRVSYVDIDSGHWPMVNKPIELASLIHTESEKL